MKVIGGLDHNHESVQSMRRLGPLNLKEWLGYFPMSLRSWQSMKKRGVIIPHGNKGKFILAPSVALEGKDTAALTQKEIDELRAELRIAKRRAANAYRLLEEELTKNGKTKDLDIRCGDGGAEAY